MPCYCLLKCAAENEILEIVMHLPLVRVFITTLILMLTAANPLAAEETAPALAETRWEIGAQGGFSFNDQDESFGQYEALVNYKLPWRWDLGSVGLGMRVISTLGTLHGGGDVGALGSLGLGFVLGDGHDLNLRIGSAATYMSEDEYGDEDLGTKFAFTSHIALTYRFWDELSARFRVQHMSNASLSDEKPGVNMIMFGLHYAF